MIQKPAFKQTLVTFRNGEESMLDFAGFIV